MSLRPTFRKQVAQLSQRDRAAGWVSYGRKWKTGTGDNIYRYYRPKSIFNHCDVFGQQSDQIRRKTQNKGYYAVQGHSRSSRSVNQSKSRMRLPITDNLSRTYVAELSQLVQILDTAFLSHHLGAYGQYRPIYTMFILGSLESAQWTSYLC